MHQLLLISCGLLFQIIQAGNYSYEGDFTSDDISRYTVSEDYGHHVYNLPRYVLYPKNENDIRKAIKQAIHEKLSIAARGHGHSNHGQCQVFDGIIISMEKYMNKILELTHEYIHVQAGIQWRHVIHKALSIGRTPPVLTDWQNFTVGGTLSTGGLGGSTFRYGAQIDNIIEFTIISGTGKRVIANRDINSDLFYAARGGLGQFGIIVEVKIKIISTPLNTTVYSLVYDDFESFQRDGEYLSDQLTGGFDTIQGLISPNNAASLAKRLGVSATKIQPSPTAQVIYILETTKNYDESSFSTSEERKLFENLKVKANNIIGTNMSFEDFANRLDGPFQAQMDALVWYLPHPWLNVFTPSTYLSSIVNKTLDDFLSFDPNAFVGLNVMNPHKFTSPFFRSTNTSKAWLYLFLSTATPPTLEQASTVNNYLANVYRQVESIGGHRYPIDLTPDSWAVHYGEKWPQFKRLKLRYDPHLILTPGQNINKEIKSCSP